VLAEFIKVTVKAQRDSEVEVEPWRVRTTAVSDPVCEQSSTYARRLSTRLYKGGEKAGQTTLNKKHVMDSLKLALTAGEGIAYFQPLRCSNEKGEDLGWLYYFNVVYTVDSQSQNCKTQHFQVKCFNENKRDVRKEKRKQSLKQQSKTGKAEQIPTERKRKKSESSSFNYKYACHQIQMSNGADQSTCAPGKLMPSVHQHYVKSCSVYMFTVQKRQAAHAASCKFC
jgi:hypothetical protein